MSDGKRAHDLQGLLEIKEMHRHEEGPMLLGIDLT